MSTISTRELPVFETERLILRGVQPCDFDSYQKNFADYAVIQHLSSGVPWPYPEKGVQSFIESVIFPIQGKERWLWVIVEKENQAEVIGAIDLWRNGIPEHRGFWLARKCWGKGYMTEAVKPVLDYAFEQLGFEVLIFSNAKGNERSRRIKEKTGATYLYDIPSRLHHPAYTESEIWELKKEDWQRLNILPHKQRNNGS